MRSKLVLKLAALGGMMLALFVLLALASSARPGVVSATANPLPPLISCPNVDGSNSNPSGIGSSSVTANDILIVVRHFYKSYGQPGYSPLYDPYYPYNSTNPMNTGKVTANDILIVVRAFGHHCPLVDTQIAKATLAISDPNFADVLCDPSLLVAVLCGGSTQFLTENATFLATKGYYQSSSDVPGQGIHYVNMNYWDGVFNPTRPEGLVYQNGVLAAQLYVVDGTVVGWGTHAATSYPPPPTPHGVDLEGATDGPQCSPACSWDGAYDGWHMHYYLCTVHIGTARAVAIPAQIVPSVQTQTGCATASSPDPECTIPITVVPCYRWGQNIGWMGHLWNWLPNANLIPDLGGSNGRFADCFPDTDNWGPFNCPA